MAVVIGGNQGLTWGWDAGADNPTDRLLALQRQEGRAETWQPEAGTVLTRRVGISLVEIDVGINVFADGVANGTNTLTSASAPWLAAMVGLPFTVYGRGRRVIESVVSDSQITFSGPVIASATDLKFTRPVGINAFLDGVTVGTNTITSASAPFTSQHVGRRTTIDDLGTRVITAFTSATEVTVDGPALPAAAGRRFTVTIFTEAADRHMLSGPKVIDSHRQQAINYPLVVRWRIGR